MQNISMLFYSYNSNDNLPYLNIYEYEHDHELFINVLGPWYNNVVDRIICFVSLVPHMKLLVLSLIRSIQQLLYYHSHLLGMLGLRIDDAVYF